MVPSYLLIRLLRSANERNMAALIEVSLEIADEEERKGHVLFADRIRKVVSRQLRGK